MDRLWTRAYNLLAEDFCYRTAIVFSHPFIPSDGSVPLEAVPARETTSPGPKALRYSVRLIFSDVYIYVAILERTGLRFPEIRRSRICPVFTESATSRLIDAVFSHFICMQIGLSHSAEAQSWRHKIPSATLLFFRFLNQDQYFLQGDVSGDDVGWNFHRKPTTQSQREFPDKGSSGESGN